jgi:CheY-like chemotaxis protein
MTKPLILLVEDNPDEVQLLSEALASVDAIFELRTTASVAGAWALLTELADGCLPALVVTDHHLVDGCGQDLLGRLQACPVREKLPVVMVSGDAQRPPDLGNIAWFTKPDTWPGWCSLAQELVGRIARR